MKRYDACSPRPKKDGGTFWHRVGTAFENDKGVTVVLDSYPLPDNEGRVIVKLFEPRNQQRQAAPQGGYDQSPAGHMGDDIPFAMEWR